MLQLKLVASDEHEMATRETDCRKELAGARPQFLVAAILLMTGVDRPLRMAWRLYTLGAGTVGVEEIPLTTDLPKREVGQMT